MGCSQVVNLAINIMLISDGELLRSYDKEGFLSLGGLIDLSPAPILQAGVTAEVLITPNVPATEYIRCLWSRPSQVGTTSVNPTLIRSTTTTTALARRYHFCEPDVKLDQQQQRPSR